jgi:hypothetical protein
MGSDGSGRCASINPAVPDAADELAALIGVDVDTFISAMVPASAATWNAPP